MPAPSRYQIPAAETRVEIRVMNSRFIASLSPVFSVDEAKAYIRRIKQEFSDASHNVPTFVIGAGNNVTAHCSDDGEPSGTAGRPALAVLQGSGLGDVAVVVTRYFGGTKLGTGGLVRAYGDAVKAVLAETKRAEKVPTHTVMAAFDYTHFENIKRLVTEFGGNILDEEFSADITLTIQFITDQFDPFNERLSELTNGVVSAEIIETNPDTIMEIRQSDRTETE